MEVFGAHDGPSGIRKAQQIRPDLILLDVLMPGLNGFDVCELLSILPETSTTPIIFLSSESDIPDRVRGLNMGASDYIAKPFHADELRARVHAQLRYKDMLDRESWRAQHDSLTGLWSRGYFDKRLQGEISLAQRQHSDLALIMADIDHFKVINDTHGHVVGDVALREVAAVLMNRGRNEDVACRYGGEEFIVICPLATRQYCTQLAESFRSAIEELEVKGITGAIKLTCSFGVSIGKPYSALLTTADWALYEAKRKGRNCVVTQDVAMCEINPADTPDGINQLSDSLSGHGI